MKPKRHSPKFEKLATSMNVTELSPEVLYEKIHSSRHPNQALVVIDVREESEWHNDPKIPEAIHLSKGVIERDIEKLVPDFSTPIVVYCSGGFRSRLAADALKKMGYRQVQSLKGGMRHYQEFLDNHTRVPW